MPVMATEFSFLKLPYFDYFVSILLLIFRFQSFFFVFIIFSKFFSLFVDFVRILIKFSFQLHYIYIKMTKYSLNDLKKFEFRVRISFDKRKILAKNNIWNPDIPRQIPKRKHTQNSFVKSISKNTIYLI